MVSMNWGEEKYDGTRYPGAQVLQLLRVYMYTCSESESTVG